MHPQHSQNSENVNRQSTNGLRMPFAEWLFRMSEAKVPYQARSLAVYAVLFKITENEELAVLSGMDTQGRADKTYNKWKKHLSDNGWVRISAETVGRKTTITVIPAVNTTPVTFTDAKPRDVRKFYENKSYERTVISTDDDEHSPVEVTTEQAPPVETTAASCAPAPAQMESPSEINIPSCEEVSQPVEVGNTSAREGLAGLNGAAYAMISDIAGWMHHGTEQTAKSWLEKTIQIFGDQVTKQAYHKLGTEMVEGRAIARPLQTWTVIAQRIQREGATSRPQKRKAALDAQREKIRAEYGWSEEKTHG